MENQQPISIGPSIFYFFIIAFFGIGVLNVLIESINFFLIFSLILIYIIGVSQIKIFEFHSDKLEIIFPFRFKPLFKSRNKTIPYSDITKIKYQAKGGYARPEIIFYEGPSIDSLFKNYFQERKNSIIATDRNKVKEILSLLKKNAVKIVLDINSDKVREDVAPFNS